MNDTLFDTGITASNLVFDTGVKILYYATSTQWWGF